jgi:hypothetical protein
VSVVGIGVGAVAVCMPLDCLSIRVRSFSEPAGILRGLGCRSII